MSPRQRRLATPEPEQIIPDTPQGPLPAPADPLVDGGDEADEERGPLRRCLVTRQSGERAQMIRFVLGPDRLIVPDLAARLPGRGFWLSPSANVLEAAIKRGVFTRAARGPVTLPPELGSLIRSGLTRRIVDLLGLARRAGQAVGGFAKAREALVQARTGLVVQAVDGSDEECRRLLSGSQTIPVIRPLTASALGAVFGRDHVVHVAVAPGRLAAALTTEAARLAGMTGEPGTMNNPMPPRHRGDRTDG